MLDLTKYKWLDSNVALSCNEDSEQLEVENFLEIMNGKEYLPGKKNVLARYYIDQHNKGNKKEKKESKLSQKDYKNWYKSASFKKLLDSILKDDKDKFIISAIVSMMMATLAMFFFNSVVHQNFVISFSIDAIIGCVTIILLIRNLKIRYKLINRYCGSKDFYYLDGLVFILCILLKIILPAIIDLTLIVLFVDHLITKKKFEKQIEEFKENLKA